MKVKDILEKLGVPMDFYNKNVAAVRKAMNEEYLRDWNLIQKMKS